MIELAKSTNSRVWEIACLLLIAVLVLTPISLVRALPVLAPNYEITSVPVPTSSDYAGYPTLAYDSGKGEIFAQYNTITGTGEVAVISDSTNKVIANISESPQAAQGYIGGMVYDSGKGEIFAAYGSSSSGALASGSSPLFSVISDSNNSIKTISWNTPGNSQYDWPVQPNGMAYDSGKGEIFVSDIHDGAVYVISDTNNAVVATIGVETNAGQLVYDSAKSEIFVANAYQVTVISDSTNKAVANVSVLASSLAYDPSKGEVFAYSGTTVYAISDSTNTVVATITGVAGGAGTIAYDSAKGEIFAGSVISDSTNAVVAQLPTGIENMVYDSGKGEILGTYAPAYYSQTPGIDIFLDSSAATQSASSSTTQSSAASSTATSTAPPYTSSTASSTAASKTSLPSSYVGVLLADLAVLLVLSVLVLSRRRARRIRTPLESLVPTASRALSL